MRGDRPAVDAAPDDDVLVDLDVEELQRRGARVLETARENGRRELYRRVRGHVDGERNEREAAEEEHRGGAVALSVRGAAGESREGQRRDGHEEGEREFFHRSLLSE